MTGVDAHADARFVFHAIDDRGKMLKFESEIAALTGGILNYCSDAFGAGEGDVD